MKSQTRSSDSSALALRLPTRIWKCGAIYFVIVFGVGFALAPLRELWAVPRFGERFAEFLEMPLMLLAIIFAARWVVRRFTIPSTLPKRLTVGIFALSLLLVAELGVVFWVRGLTLSEYLAGRDPVSGAAYIVMLLVYAVMPTLVYRQLDSAK